MSDYHPRSDVHCVYCGHPLYESPTKLGWVKKDRTSGVCFDCIDTLYVTMQAHRKMESTQEGK